VRTIVKPIIALAAFAAATCFDVPASHAFGDAPWCAVIEIGTGMVYWDCQYRTVEACVPNVLAGNRGFCNLNPWPGPSAATAVSPRHRIRHAQR
jgi:hypothetical protein